MEEIRSINENILQCMSSNQVSKKEIDDIVNKINTSLLSNAESSFGKVKLKDSQMHETPKWFGSKCSNSRKKFHRARYNYKLRKTNHNRDKLKNASKEYKTTVKHFYNKFRKHNVNKIRNLRTTNPKKYWKILNGKITRKY